MHPSFNEICGISQKELEANFVEELELYDKEKLKNGTMAIGGIWMAIQSITHFLY